MFCWSITASICQYLPPYLPSLFFLSQSSGRQQAPASPSGTYTGVVVELERRTQAPHLYASAREDREAKVTQAIADALGASDTLRLASRDLEVPDTHRLKGRLVIAKDSEGGPLGLVFTLRGKDDYGTLFFEAEGIAPADDQGLDPQLRVATAALINTLDPRLEVAGADPATLEKKLRAGKADELLRAVHEVGRRRATELAPAIADLLVHDHDDVVFAALAALGLLKDKNSVRLVNDLMVSKNPRKVEQAIYVLGDIGGDEARDILTKAHNEHPHPAIRQWAGYALERMK